jgi:hypothetical protein
MSKSSTEENECHYKIPRPSHSSSSGSDEEKPSGIYRAFSPDHYEFGPSDTEANIYENAEVEVLPSKEVTQKKKLLYQNLSFDGQPLSKTPKPLPPLKKFGSPQLQRIHQLSKAHSTVISIDGDNEYIDPDVFNIAESDIGTKSLHGKH